MAELRHTAGLTQKSGPIRVQRKVAGPWNFDGHNPIQLRIARLVDSTECADSNGLEQLELAHGMTAVRRGDLRARSLFQIEARPA